MLPQSRSRSRSRSRPKMSRLRIPGYIHTIHTYISSHFTHLTITIHAYQFTTSEQERQNGRERGDYWRNSVFSNIHVFFTSAVPTYIHGQMRSDHQMSRQFKFTHILNVFPEISKIPKTAMPIPTSVTQTFQSRLQIHFADPVETRSRLDFFVMLNPGRDSERRLTGGDNRTEPYPSVLIAG